jgi:hypothetical protein
MSRKLVRRRLPVGRAERRLIEELSVMNCELVQRRLLASESPGQPGAEVRRHLAACPACRAWQRRLAQAEEQLPQLATPPSVRKDRVVQLILNAPNPAAHARYGRTPWSDRTVRERGLRKAALAIALAAALVVFALAWWLIGQPTPAPQPQTSPLIAKYQKQRDELIVGSQPGTPQRVEKLADFADRFVQRDVAAAQNDAEKLRQMAAYYTAFMPDEFVGSVRRAAPQLSREQMVALVDQLDRADSMLSKLAADPELKPENRAALNEMAVAARASRNQVLLLLQNKRA